MIKWLKKFWYLFFIPIILFVLSRIFRFDTSDLDRKIKEKKKEIKNQTKKVEKEEQKVKEKEEKLDASLKSTKEKIKQNLEDKDERDEKAKDYFPDS